MHLHYEPDVSVMLAISTVMSPSLLVSPLRTPVAPMMRGTLVSPLRAPFLRMDSNDKGSWVNGKWVSKGQEGYWMSPSLSGEAAASATSVLDTTPRFEEIASAAATQGSAAAVEGFEPGTCDPYDPKSAEFCSPELPADAPFLSKRTLKLTVLFFLWYALNTAYNIGNKLVLTALPIPWTSATIELFFGLPYVGMLWLTGLRKKPKLSMDNIKTLAPSAFFLSATHVGGVISFGAGAISFTHVLKATEPVWTVLLSAVFFREFLPWQIYASLVPIIGGVSLASLKEVSFSWLSFIAGTGSAVTSASKAILSKKVLDGKVCEHEAALLTVMMHPLSLWRPRSASVLAAPRREPHPCQHVRCAHHPRLLHAAALLARHRGAPNGPHRMGGGACSGLHGCTAVDAPGCLRFLVLHLQRGCVPRAL